jgi:hypothetical protein
LLIAEQQRFAIFSTDRIPRKNSRHPNACIPFHIFGQHLKKFSAVSDDIPKKSAEFSS